MVAGVAAVVVGGHNSSKFKVQSSRLNRRTRAGGDENLGGADDAVVELVTDLGSASDRPGRILVAGFLGDCLVEIGVKRRADRVDANALMLFEDGFELGGDHFDAVEKTA